MNELAIVTSCDERYAPLAKGLILSLLANEFPQPGQQLCLLDIGCSPTTRQWMADRGVHVERFDAESHLPFRTGHLPNHIAAMAFRPFMRGVFPGFQVYLWLDSDTWVQHPASVHLYHELAKSNPHRIAISPLIDVHYSWQYNAKKFRSDLERIYGAIYGAAGKELAWRPILGAGVFAMHRDSRVWQAWATQLPVVYRQDYSQVSDGLHLAEQTALNRVIYTLGGPSLVEAIHNYHLCAGPTAWFDGQLCSKAVMWVDGQLTHRPIGIVHLCSLSTYAHKYVQARAFYDRGRYLTDSELNSIESLRKGSQRESPR